MSNVRLNALSVERAFRNDPRFLLNDGEDLYLRKQAKSGAFWTLRYRFAERNRWMTLGHYPDMNLATARAEARASSSAAIEARSQQSRALLLQGACR
jgi:hypothetical protein